MLVPVCMYTAPLEDYEKSFFEFRLDRLSERATTSCLRLERSVVPHEPHFDREAKQVICSLLCFSSLFLTYSPAYNKFTVSPPLMQEAKKLNLYEPCLNICTPLTPRLSIRFGSLATRTRGSRVNWTPRFSSLCQSGQFTGLNVSLKYKNYAACREWKYWR